MTKSTSLIDFELENNPILKKLYHPAYKYIMSVLLRNGECAVCLPLTQEIKQSKLENWILSGGGMAEFLQTHCLYGDFEKHGERNGEIGKYVSLNGIQIRLKKDDNDGQNYLETVSSVPEGEMKMEFMKDVSCRLNFGVEDKSLQKILVLRERKIELVQKKLTKKVTLFLLSEPIVYKGCKWENLASHQNDKLSELIDAHQRSASNQLFPDEMIITEPQVNPKPVFKPTLVKKHKNPYTFKDFVDKMKRKDSAVLVKKIKLFVDEVNSKQYDQSLVEKVRKFLGSLMKEIKMFPQWKDASELEIDNAREGIEKYVMTKIYQKCFCPTSEDLKNDEEISKRLKVFKEIPPEKLEIPPGVVTHELWITAIDELNKMNNFKTPRDKMICISNCCKIVFKILSQLNPEQSAGADAFLPVLIYLVVQANPLHLHSNLTYVSDFRNPNKMLSESGYFLTNLMSCAQFWLTCGPDELMMTQAEYNRFVGEQYFDDDDLLVDTPISEKSNKFSDKTTDESNKERNEDSKVSEGDTVLNGNKHETEDYKVNDVSSGNEKNTLKDHKVDKEKGESDNESETSDSVGSIKSDAYEDSDKEQNENSDNEEDENSNLKEVSAEHESNDDRKVNDSESEQESQAKTKNPASQPNNEYPRSFPTSSTLSDVDSTKSTHYPFLDRTFESLSIAELREIFEIYQNHFNDQ